MQGPNGKWRALQLEGVRADRVVALEPNGREEPANYALARITTAVELRYRQKRWNKGA